jgi:protocatechuate 3,4-dioxygenase beta subunit
MLVGGVVKGTVFGQGGAPLARGFVHLESEMSDLVYDVRTDSEGRYSFSHVRPGSYTLSATGKATASNNAFEGIVELRTSQVQISVNEGGETQRDLSLSGG